MSDGSVSKKYTAFIFYQAAHSSGKQSTLQGAAPNDPFQTCCIEDFLTKLCMAGVKFFRHIHALSGLIQCLAKVTTDTY